MAKGRPSLLGKEKKILACALAKVGLSRREIARELGCVEGTIRYALAHDEAFARDFAVAQGDLQIHLLTQLRRNSARSWRASAWALERILPERYGDVRTRQNAEKVRLLREMRDVMAELKGGGGKVEEQQEGMDAKEEGRGE
jgi:hypothetical protein